MTHVKNILTHATHVKILTHATYAPMNATHVTTQLTQFRRPYQNTLKHENSLEDTIKYLYSINKANLFKSI